MWKQKRVVDERIQKESNCLSGKMYYVITLLSVISLIIKLVWQLPIYVYGLEIIALVAGFAYYVVNELRKGIFLIRKKDEELLNVHYNILAKAQMTMFWIYILGEVIYLFAVKEHFYWIVSYIIIWGIPSLIVAVASVKNGWLIWGTKKKEVEGKEKFKKRLVFSSLVFGVIVGFPMLYHDGRIYPEGILWILGLSAAWGVLFYIMFTGVMQLAEKRADKKLEEKEKEYEE